ncbi:MAG: hypothetical protein ACRDYZ_07525 [Acidimicrobiales bacterium]
MTTYLLSQEGRNCRVHAAWWTPDGEETAGVVLMPDRKLAARLAHSLTVLSDAVWSQSVDAPGEPLGLPKVVAELGPGGGDGDRDASDHDEIAAAVPVARSPGSGATRLRARIAEDEARTIVELTSGLSDETIASVKEEIASELAAAAATAGPALEDTDRRWQRFRRISPVGFLALWAEDDDPSAPLLAWAVGRSVESLPEDGGTGVTRSVGLGEGIEVHITPDAVGEEPVLRIDMQCEGETLAYLDIEDVESFGHAGSLLAELRERLSPQFLVDAVVRTAATYRGAPSDEDLEAFDGVVKRLMRLLPAEEASLDAGHGPAGAGLHSGEPGS